MGHATLTEDPLVTDAVSRWIKLSQIKGIMGLIRSLNCARSTPTQPQDLAWALIAVREMIEALENDLEEAGSQLRKCGGLHLAHPTKDQAKVNGHPKWKAKVSKGGSRNGHPT